MWNASSSSLFGWTMHWIYLWSCWTNLKDIKWPGFEGDGWSGARRPYISLTQLSLVQPRLEFSFIPTDLLSILPPEHHGCSHGKGHGQGWGCNSTEWIDVGAREKTHNVPESLLSRGLGLTVWSPIGNPNDNIIVQSISDGHWSGRIYLKMV